MRLLVKDDSFDVDPGKLSFGEAKKIESATGLTFTQWGNQLAAGSLTALQALVWVMLRRTNPELRFDDVDDFNLEEVAIVGDEAAKPKGAGRRPVDPTRKAS